MKRDKLVDLLSSKGKEQEALFTEARTIRNKAKVPGTLRGTVEVSNACQEMCSFCPMAAYNETLQRFRLSDKEIVAQAQLAREYGINTLMLQSGETPGVPKYVTKLLPDISAMGFSEIILNLGNHSRETYQQLKDAGATAYILKQETSNPKLYREMKASTLSERLECLNNLKEVGFRVGMGSICGLPNQTLKDVANDILLTQKFQPDMVSISPLIPAKETPYAQHESGDVNLALNAIALLRILNPEAYIPAVSALEKLQEGAQLQGLQAGANVLTANMTPESRREDYVIYGKDRYVVKVEYARSTLEKEFGVIQ